MIFNLPRNIQVGHSNEPLPSKFVPDTWNWNESVPKRMNASWWRLWRWLPSKRTKKQRRTDTETGGGDMPRAILISVGCWRVFFHFFFLFVCFSFLFFVFVFVSFLPLLKTKPETNKTRYGTIISTKAILDKNTNKCKGYGFVDFESPQAAESAVKALQLQGIQAQMAKVIVKVKRIYTTYFFFCCCCCCCCYQLIVMNCWKKTEQI